MRLSLAGVTWRPNVSTSTLRLRAGRYGGLTPLPPQTVEAALRGEPEQLAALILQPNPQLEPDTWKLVAEFVKGERNPHTGRDPPPLKWSDLRYVFDIKEDCNDKEAIQA